MINKSKLDLPGKGNKMPFYFALAKRNACALLWKSKNAVWNLFQTFSWQELGSYSLEATLIPVLSFEFTSLDSLFEKVSLKFFQLSYFQQDLLARIPFNHSLCGTSFCVATSQLCTGKSHVQHQGPCPCLLKNEIGQKKFTFISCDHKVSQVLGHFRQLLKLLCLS